LGQAAGAGAPIADASMSDDTTSLLALRRDLYQRFGPAQVALSANGMDVHFAAGIEAGLVVGRFAVLGADDVAAGGALVVQVLESSLVEREGPALEVPTDVEVAGAHVSAATVRPVLRFIAGTGVVLGTLDGLEFTPRDAVDPFGEQVIRPARADEVAAIAAGLHGDTAVIELGRLRHAPHVPACVRAKGFARHTFMCGQSGSGKTYATGALFERLLAATTLPIMVLDPNSDHVQLGRLRDPGASSDEAEPFRAVAPSVRVARARGVGGAYTLCTDFSDLAFDWQSLLLRLHPVHDADEFAALRRITSSLATPYSADDVRGAGRRLATDDPLAGRIARRIENLGIADWAVWRRGDETSISTVGLRHERCVVFDVGSLQRPEERATVALAVLGALWRRRGDRSPVLIAIDEAHNVVPASTDDPLLQATSDLGVLIAGEGRKFGLHLFVATQRPAKVHPNVVSQCDNLALMRMNGARDVEDVVALFSHIPPALVREAPSFGLGEVLLAGPIAPVPIRAEVGSRLSPEGGADVPTTWAARPGPIRPITHPDV
jgi:uncharacterized protein